MSANFALSRDCQLFRRDVEGVLSLASQLLLLTPAPGSPADAPPSSSPRLLAGPLIGAVLTEANVRSLLLNTLVRVLVPSQRQSALLQGNRYVQVANEVAKKHQQQQQQQQQNATTGSSSSGGANNTNNNTTSKAAVASSSTPHGDQQQQQYRVGRVVGVVPKPSASGKNGSAGTAAAGDASVRFLLAVYVGECVEPVPVTALSDDAFTEAEHRIFVQSALSTNRDDGSRRAGVLPSQQPALLSSEMAATVRQSVEELRRVLDVVAAVANETTAAAAKVDAYRSEIVAAAQHAGGGKRPREGEDEQPSTRAANGASTNATTAEEAEGMTASSLSTFFGSGATSQAARLARLTDDVAARGAQLQQLRQLLQQKDQEVKTALQQQQQQEARHHGEMDVWRAKVEEQGKAQERAAKEAAESQEKRDRLLDDANTKLRRLAGLATKYKQVVDTVATLLKRGGDEAATMGPDEILAALQHRTFA